MPRRMAPLLTSIWDDKDFQTLTPEGQRMYLQILSQKRLSLCGVVPYSPRNWSRGCSDLDVEAIEGHVGELVDRGYVWIDHDTEELIVRTMVKHDPPRGARSIAGMWNDWREIDSQAIRSRVVHSIPPEIWHHETVEPPDDAKALRKAPCDGASDGASDDRESTGNEQGAASVLRPPATSHRPPDSPASGDEPTSPDDESRTKKIIDLIVTERCKNARPTNMTSYRAKVTEDVTANLGARIDELAGMFPTAPDRTIATAADTGETRPLAYFTEESA